MISDMFIIPIQKMSMEKEFSATKTSNFSCENISPGICESDIYPWGPAP